MLAHKIACEGAWESTARIHTCLIGWNSRELPDILQDNGTCSLIQTRTGRFIITCEHVWTGYEKYRSQNKDARLWISLVTNRFDVHSAAYALPLSSPRAISVNPELDLAVLSFDNIGQLDPWRFYSFRSAGCARTHKGDIVHFLGFPGEMVKVGASDRALNYSFSSLVTHDVSTNRFLLHSAERTLHHKNSMGQQTGPFRICGASGAPVFRVKRNNELCLAGVVTQLSSRGLWEHAEGYQMSDGDIFVTHADFIQDDGSILPT